MPLTDVFLPPGFETSHDSSAATAQSHSFGSVSRDAAAPAQLQRLLARFADLACVRNEHQLAVPHA